MSAYVLVCRPPTFHALLASTVGATSLALHSYAGLLWLVLLTYSLTAQDRQVQNKDKRKRLAAALESGQRIIIDLDFADLMTDQVTKHCTFYDTQVLQAYLWL